MIYLSWDQFSPARETEAAKRFLECDLCQSNARKSCKYTYPQNQQYIPVCQEEGKKMVCMCWVTCKSDVYCAEQNAFSAILLWMG